MYSKGKGVPQDYAEAVKWLRKAADQGVADAQFNLGLLYLGGDGVNQNYAEAAKWCRKAAEQGDVDAQFNLGLMYLKGDGVNQNYAEAAKWFRKAADQGDANTQYNLGLMYFRGDGVRRDYTQAYKWIDLSTAGLSGEERKNAATFRDTVISRLMTPQQIEEAQRLAKEWKSRRAKLETFGSGRSNQ